MTASEGCNLRKELLVPEACSHASHTGGCYLEVIPGFCLPQNQVSCLIYSLIYTTTSVLSQIVAPPPKQEMCSPEAVNATLLRKRLLADFEIKNLEVGLTCMKVSPKSDDRCPGKSS